MSFKIIVVWEWEFPFSITLCFIDYCDVLKYLDFIVYSAIMVIASPLFIPHAVEVLDVT